MTAQNNNDFIQNCLQSQHLEPSVIKKYQHSFRNHPNRILRIKNFLKPAVAERLSDFALNEAQYRRIYALHANNGRLVSYKTWQAAKRKQRLYCCWEAERHIKDKYRLSQNWLTYMFWLHHIDNNSSAFLQFMQSVTGYTLESIEPITLRKMAQGDYLGKHADRRQKRCLAWLLYLSDDWQEAFGGSLQINDSDKNTVDYPPLYNSLLIFDVYKQQSHNVPALNAAAQDWVRITLGSWVNGQDNLQ